MADVKIPELVYILICKALLYDEPLSDSDSLVVKKALMEKENKRMERAEHVANYKWEQRVKEFKRINGWS